MFNHACPERCLLCHVQSRYVATCKIVQVGRSGKVGKVCMDSIGSIPTVRPVLLAGVTVHG